MRACFLLIFLALFGSCSSTYVRYTDMPHVQNAQRIRVISKTKLKYETMKHFSSEVLHDTIVNYQPCKPEGNNDECLLYLEKKRVIQFRGSYYVRSSAFVNYMSQEKFKKYINKDVKF